MAQDASKSWNDPPTFRRAVKYVVGVLVLAGVIAAVALVWAASRQQCLAADSIVCDTTARLTVGLGPGLILLLGGIGAFVITIRYWRSDRPWPIWQGAGWFLFVVMLVYLTIAESTG